MELMHLGCESHVGCRCAIGGRLALQSTLRLNIILLIAALGKRIEDSSWARIYHREQASNPAVQSSIGRLAAIRPIFPFSRHCHVLKQKQISRVGRRLRRHAVLIADRELTGRSSSMFWVWLMVRWKPSLESQLEPVGWDDGWIKRENRPRWNARQFSEWERMASHMTW